MSPVELFLLATVTGSIAEMGDKTQLLTVLLAARLKKPLPIAAGMLVATLTQRFAAAALGDWASGLAADQVIHIVVGTGFIALAIWVMTSTQSVTTEFPPEWTDRLSPFSISAAAFFLAEIGDKSQIITAALATKFGHPFVTGMGASIGMLIAFVPALLFGRFVVGRIQIRVASWSLALILAILGVVTFLGVGV